MHAGSHDPPAQGLLAIREGALPVGCELIALCFGELFQQWGTLLVAVRHTRCTRNRAYRRVEKREYMLQPERDEEAPFEPDSHIGSYRQYGKGRLYSHPVRPAPASRPLCIMTPHIVANAWGGRGKACLTRVSGSSSYCSRCSWGAPSRSKSTTRVPSETGSSTAR